MADLLTDDQKSLVTLIETVKNLGKNQDEFRKEVKDSIDDLKNNYSNRIQGIEEFKNNADKVFAAKHDQDMVNEDLNKQVNSLKQWRSYITGAVAILAIIVLPIMAWLAVSVINHMADDKANEVNITTFNQNLTDLKNELHQHIDGNK